jgi:phosphoglycolate phosphatase-like HAD superfamily hydrolase
MLIKQYETIFWDFDGVIKESIELKENAFVELFQSYGSIMTERVRKHHQNNGGLSRYEKIPLYMQWAGENKTQKRIDEYCFQFSQIVIDNIIKVPWVSGVEDYLRKHFIFQNFIIVSATPQKEIEIILQKLKLNKIFVDVFGSPTSKMEAINYVLKNQNVNPQKCLMIGDSNTDLEAAQINQIQFLLRRHKHNAVLEGKYSSSSIDDFSSLI